MRPEAARSSRSASSIASSHDTGSKPRSRTRLIGSTMRSSVRRCVKANRPLSQIQPSSISGWLRDRIRLTLPSRTVALTLQPTGHMPQTVGTFWISHGRPSKRYWVGSSAPTGQSSVTLPVNGPLYGSSSNVVITDIAPRLRATS